MLTAVVFEGRGPILRTYAKFGLENGRNKGEMDVIKMYKLQKLARLAFSSFDYYHTKRI